MSGPAPIVLDIAPRSRRASAKVAQEVASQVETTCTASACVCDLLAEGKPGAEAWESALVAIVDALAENDRLARLLRAERDQFILALSTGGPDGRPWRNQAYLARLAGVTDSYTNRVVRDYWREHGGGNGG